MMTSKRTIILNKVDRVKLSRRHVNKDQNEVEGTGHLNIEWHRSEGAGR